MTYSRRTFIAPLAVLLALLMFAPPAVADREDTEHHEGGQRGKVSKATFAAAKPGEALLDITASVPGADWQKAGRESAVVTVTLDGKYNQDVVLFMGQQKFTYQVALGPVKAGKHTVEVAFNPEKSPPAARGASVKKLKTQIVPEGSKDALAYKYSPILYGRDLPEIPGRYENNYTDTPLLMYHTVNKEADGNTTIEYTVIWSNEDGGTNTPALMARWGRSTDIEWIYRVTLDPQNRIVSEVYQAPGHGTLPFNGAKEGGHPFLVTSTSNNNVSPVFNPEISTGYRFFMDPSQTLPQNRAREVMMDKNPWSYQVMAKEMNREGKIEPKADPATPAVSDQRNYLYIEIDKDTVPPNSNPGAWVGTAVAVKLKGDATWYTSHHNIPDWSIQRDIPAATTVELPPGAGVRDIEAVKAMAVPVDYNPADSVMPPRDYRITVTAINRAFFLDEVYLPRKSFIGWQGSVVLTPEQPEAVIWEAP